MTSSTVEERNTRTIHTAACLIIGDEVLGGKVSSPFCLDREVRLRDSANMMVDG